MKRSAVELHDSDDESSNSDESVTVLTSASAAAAASSTLSGPRAGTSKCSNSWLSALYEERSPKSFTCSKCAEGGVDPKSCTGYRLSLFCVQHSRSVHAKDSDHARAIALFPFRKSSKLARIEQLTARSTALGGGAPGSSSGSAPRQSSLREFARKPTDTTESDVLLELAAFMVRAHVAPNALQLFGPVLNAAASFGARTQHIQVNLPSRKTFMEEVVEGTDGLLGKVVDDATRSDGEFMSKAKRLGAVMQFDSQRDINGRDLVPVVVSSPGGRHLVSVLASAGSKTAAWYTEQLTRIIKGDYSVTDQETNTSTTGRALSSAGAASLLTTAANAPSKYIFMVCSDHAAAEQSALRQLEITLAVLPCGDPAHAIHNTAKYLCKPFEQVIKDCHDAVVLFRMHSALKEKLRTELGSTEGASNAFTCLVLDVDTRFLSHFLMINSVLRAAKALKNIVNNTFYDDWIDRHDEHTDAAASAKELVNDSSAMKKLKFVHAMLTPLVKMCRFFDAARTGSLSFVYPMWNSLTESILLELAKPEYEDVLDSAVVYTIKETVLDCWDRFDFDVYAAAYLCNPYFLKQVSELNESSTPDATSSSSSSGDIIGNSSDDKVREYCNLRDAFERVVTTMVRRFPPELGAEARAVPLLLEAPELKRQVAKCMREMDTWLAEPEKAIIFDAEEFERAPSLPSKFWTRSALTSIRAYCARLVDACVGSTDIERVHAMQGMHRTKRRNRMGYVRSHALSYVDMCLRTKREAPSKEWGLGMMLLSKFMELTDEDEVFLNAMEERLSAVRAEEKEEEEEQQQQEAASEADALDAEAEPPAAASTQPQVRSRTRRGTTSRFMERLAELVEDGAGEDSADESYDGDAPPAASRRASRRGRRNGRGGAGRTRGSRRSISTATDMDPSLEI